MMLTGIADPESPESENPKRWSVPPPPLGLDETPPGSSAAPSLPPPTERDKEEK